MQPSVLFVATFYPEFLTELYGAQPGLRERPYAEQTARILQSNFSSVEAYIDALRPLGCRAELVIVNADELQRRWAEEHGLTPTGNIHDQRRQILAAQVEAMCPDVLHVFEWAPMGDAFLAEIRPRVRLLSGQIASPLRPERTYGAYDLMISSWPPIVDYFRAAGLASEGIRHAFDVRVLQGLPASPPQYDVTFVGGFAPSHPNRVPWLEGLLEHVPVDIFGYGLERVPAGSPIHGHHRGPAWGWDMYRVLQQSRLTLNLHAVIDVRGRADDQVAANMRLYEATGMGTCLVTEWKPNLADMFEPDREVVTFRDVEECAARIRHYLAEEQARSRIAAAGHARTLREHTYAARMGELLGAWRKHLDRVNRKVVRAEARALG